MQEYISEAVILSREPAGDMDTRLSIFTKRYGKFIAKVKSARKITSKLSGHLEPGFVVRARLVEKNGLQVVDALQNAKLDINPPDLYFLDRLLHEAEPDLQLWAALISHKFSWQNILRILGWDPQEAQCSMCGKNPKIFNVADQEFFCENCALRLSQNELICI